MHLLIRTGPASTPPASIISRLPPQISDVMPVRELTVGFRLVPEGKQRVNMNF